MHAQIEPEQFKPYDYEGAKEFFKSVIGNENFTFLVAKEDGEAIGYAWIELVDKKENVFKYGYRSIHVHHISFNNGRKRKGCGRKMMSYIEEMAKDFKAEKIDLNYFESNVTAGQFYEKIGFKKTRIYVYKECR